MEKQNNENDFREPPIVQNICGLYELAHRKVSGFPKHERYSVGEKIENAILDCAELAIAANIVTKYEKEKYLVRLGAKIDLLKILCRLIFNLKFIDWPAYLELEKRLKELGKMTGGWIKYARREN